MAQAGSDRYSPFGRHVACHPLEQMLAALTFAADGVLERFPELKVAQLEAGEGNAFYQAARHKFDTDPAFNARALPPCFTRNRRTPWGS